ncbi:KpsF/GutQ family sugar-phosphate isomerase [Ferrovibrio sp.]|uniref:KpsF/GutQ family sugar-phosphate isomerase n=1 Tax=Ferrovibrio sp. TaxID=1917215 RepID=UPI001B7389DB|nr:KpsF/GutQ family sugar-phosphate isomerase [Ferrovibrio sp.]MBP7064619.1 KpsF/GutQ family sugar-phosphate isomerase [Ferrovibrio sp.]
MSKSAKLPAARRKVAGSRSVAAKAAPATRKLPVGDIAVARRVLLTEAKGLTVMAAGLNGDFSRALDVLARVGGEGGHGRVIVSGMGKSGHVARKIAATMASTGTPAMFVHPGEASHGDLGMVMPGDALICLSNSGETKELADLIAHAKRFAIPLIGITAKARSALGQASDVVLELPPVEEACSIGMAPTTSTTMMLALGDALAVALLDRKGFTREDFHNFHPGGKLGSQLVKVKNLMHTGPSLPLVPVGTGMGEALVMMTGRSFGCIGIVGKSGRDKGRLVGIVTDGDLRRHIGNDLLSRQVEQVMTKAPAVIGPNLLAGEALLEMNKRRITAFFVVDGGKPIGILHMHDCVRAGLT